MPSPGGQWLLCCGEVGSQTQLWAPAQRKRHPQLCRPQGSGSPSPCSHCGRRDREGPRTSTCQPGVQTRPHLARSMMSPGGARELPVHQQWPLWSKSAARPLLFSFLGWGPWSCRAKPGYVQPPLATHSSLWASVAPCARAGPKVAPLSPSLDTLPGRYGASPSPPKGTRAGHTPGQAEMCPLPPPKPGNAGGGEGREAQRPGMEPAQE